MTTTRRARCTYGGCLLAALLVAAAGCGRTPAPVEVTEPWTSGDERALGIDEPAADPAGATAASASDTTTDEGDRSH